MRVPSYFCRWAVDFEYDYDRDCDRAGCDSICRCGRFSNVRASNVSLAPDHISVEEQYVDRAGKNRKRTSTVSRIERYCIDRLMRVHKAYDTSLYEAHISGGYYGEEIVGASFENERAMLSDIQEMLNLGSDAEKVKFALHAEYASLLDVIQDLQGVMTEMVDLKKMVRNDAYAERLKRDYSGYNFGAEDLPVGVALRIAGGIRIIDGYHRLTALLADGKKKGLYIVLE
jgi:hypothetical protein